MIASRYIEGQRYCNEYGIPAQKRLKKDAVPIIFPKSNEPTDSSDSRSSATTQGRALSVQREQRSVSSCRDIKF